MQNLSPILHTLFYILEFIRDFEKETHTFIDAEKQIKHEKHLENEYGLDK